MNLSQTLSQIIASLPALWAEYMLIFGILGMVIIMLIFPKKKQLFGILFGVLTLATAALILPFCPQKSDLFLGMLRTDRTVIAMKSLLFFAGIATFFYQLFLPSNAEDKPAGEWFPLILTLILGGSLMVMSTNLLMMYVATEIVSISSYLLATLRKNNPQAAEAGIKYTLFGAFASAIMIYGISWFYGCTGTLDLTQGAWVENMNHLPLFTQTIVYLLIFVGFLFKINAIPLHFWTPDVYEGTDFGTAAQFSVVPKVAALVMWVNLLRLFPLSATLQTVLIGLAILSMTAGNIAAIGQTNVKRLLAYSSIAHSGFLLMALLPQTAYSYKALFFYLWVYTCMNLAIFFATGYISALISSEKISDFQGLGKYFPLITVCLVVLLFSLTGLPPTAGFIAKWYVFLAVWEKWTDSQQLIWLIALISAVLNTVISLFYYMRLPVMMVFRPAKREVFSPKNIGMSLLIGLLTALILAGGIFVRN